MSDQQDNHETANEMGGATGITGGGDSGRPGEGVQSRDRRNEELGESQGAGAADLNAGQPALHDTEQPDIGHGGDPGGASQLG